jgi:predicted transglutaminase-like cysteine proteinase
MASSRSASLHRLGCWLRAGALAVAVAAGAHVESAAAQQTQIAIAVTGSLRATTAQAAPDRGLFGTVPVAVAAVAVSGRWNEILADDPARIFIRTCPGTARVCDTPLVRSFSRIAEENEARPFSRLDLLRRVNAAVNRSVRYQDDIVTYGVSDHWATPMETALMGAGDCEDFAIAKMGMLAALGMPMHSMSLTVVKDLRKGIGHAILSVSLGETMFVLDNQSEEVREDRTVTAYQALYSVSDHGNWLHGVRRQLPVMQASLADDLNRGEPMAQLRGALGTRPAAGALRSVH